MLLPDSDSVFAYTRTLDKERLLVLCNFTEEEQHIEIPKEFQGNNNKILISNYGRENVGKMNVLRPYEAIVIYHQ